MQPSSSRILPGHSNLSGVMLNGRSRYMADKSADQPTHSSIETLATT